MVGESDGLVVVLGLRLDHVQVEVGDFGLGLAGHVEVGGDDPRLPWRICLNCTLHELSLRLETSPRIRKVLLLSLLILKDVLTVGND